MPEDPKSLIAAAIRAVEEFKISLELGYKTVHDIPSRLEQAKKALAVARKRLDRANAEYRIARDEDRDREYEHELQEEIERAYSRVSWAKTHTAGDDVDVEYQKAIARQIAGLGREESTKRLDDIAILSNDPKVQSTVAECKDEVSKAAYRLIKAFPEARPLLGAEVRKARAEAHRMIDGFDFSNFREH